MKSIKYFNKLTLVVAVAVAGLLSSCSAFDDYLTVYPTNQITGEQFWEDQNDLNSVVNACYVQLASSAVTQRMFVWGELRSDNFLLTSESNEDLKNMMNANLLETNSWFTWDAFYKGIGFCNLCLQKGPEVVEKDVTFSLNDWEPIEAELKTIRALNYFYLVRAFRDVPFVINEPTAQEQSANPVPQGTSYFTDTSVGADNPVPQIGSEEVLTYLINDLEAVKDKGMKSYGYDADNKGRITRNAIYALLCDMYLWRAAKNTSADSLAAHPGEAEADYRKVIEYADILTQNLLADFEKEKVDLYYGSAKSSFSNVDPLPLYVTRKSNRVEDIPYNEIFGYKFSLESLFELAYSSGNPVYSSFFGYYDGNNFKGGTLSASSAFQQVGSKPDQATTAFSKSDLRCYETIERTTGATAIAIYNIVKFNIMNVTQWGVNDLTSTSAGIEFSKRGSTQNMNYMMYRYSDILLMKAEAIAALHQYVLKSEDQDALDEGFNCAKAVFARANPMIDQADELDFANGSSQMLEDFVLRERQRELYGEGKRWFDLVRYALRNGSTTKMLNLLVLKYSTNASAIKAKLATINSLYNPVHKDEMKINTALVQNPAWITDETIVKN